MLGYLLQLAGLLVLPLVFCVGLWRSREPDLCRWLLRVLYTGAFLTYVLMLGRWDVLSVYLRYVPLLAYALAVLLSFAAVRGRPWFASPESAARWHGYVVPVAMTLLFGTALAWVVRGYLYSEPAVALEWPLRDGWFYVGQGGNSTILNYHNPLRAQRYALDIVALNDFGRRAHGLNSKELSSYVIFGAPVHSPCDGRVTAAIDQFPDQVPPESDRRNLAGNHVVISCQGASILLAHMQAGSIAVTAGQSVLTGTMVGRVGNSGNTSEPHLHMHAVRDGSGTVLNGQGIPMLLAGKFPVRNSTIRVHAPQRQSSRHRNPDS